MKAFSFRLQSILDVRRRQEDQQKQVLHQALAKYEESKQALAAFFNRQEQLFQRIRRLQTGSLNLPELSCAQDYALVIKTQIIAQQRVVAACSEAVEEERAKLLEIVKARKILEKLKERHYLEYRLEALREEQKLIDEMAAGRIAR